MGIKTREFTLNDLEFSDVINGLNKYFAEPEPRPGFVEVNVYDGNGIFYRFDAEMWLDKLITWLRTEHGIFYYPGMDAKYAKTDKILPSGERMKEVVKTDKSKAATTERHFCINVATYDIPDFERWDASPTKRMNLYYDGDIIGQLYVIKERYKLASFNDAVLLDFIITKDDIDLNAINDIYTLDYGFTVNEVENEITLLLYTI